MIKHEGEIRIEKVLLVLAIAVGFMALAPQVASHPAPPDWAKEIVDQAIEKGYVPGICSRNIKSRLQ